MNKSDKQVSEIINKEYNRQKNGIELIASENFTSENSVTFSWFTSPRTIKSSKLLRPSVNDLPNIFVLIIIVLGCRRATCSPANLLFPYILTGSTSSSLCGPILSG